MGLPLVFGKKFFKGVPQESILGPLLSNMFQCGMFVSIQNSYFTNYAGDTTPYVTGNYPEELVSLCDQQQS